MLVAEWTSYINMHTRSSLSLLVCIFSNVCCCRNAKVRVVCVCYSDFPNRNNPLVVTFPIHSFLNVFIWQRCRRRPAPAAEVAKLAAASNGPTLLIVLGVVVVIIGVLVGVLGGGGS